MRNTTAYKFVGKKVIIRLHDRVCEDAEELITSSLFREVTERFIRNLERRQSHLLSLFQTEEKDIQPGDINRLIETFRVLSKMNVETVPKLIEGSDHFISDLSMLSEFVENLYNYWREFERFIICDSTGDRLDKRPYRTFNSTVESLTHLVRQVYRDIQENISGQPPSIYRQVRAGAEMAVIALPRNVALPEGSYHKLCPVLIIRQLLLYPPLLIRPPMNKRTGIFERIERNPVDLIQVNPDEWICYPAKVGPLLILVYIHEKFYEMGLALCNLFELADDAFLKRPVDGIFMFGVPGNVIDSLAPLPAIFYDDIDNKLIMSACPNSDLFGYYGYLKKMILTMHNIKIMKMGRLPFHGALVRIVLKNKKSLTVLLIGDTGAGKSETLEALRIIGEEVIEEMVIIADDMGSLEFSPDGKLMGYGTEVGAFVRLDDLQQGYAFGQLDRAIIMNPNQVNARIVLPVTTYEHVTKGYSVDMVLYANNYEETDNDHPVIKRFSTVDEALNVFREGTAMSKGTTTSTGLTHTYFVNIFGPVQYREVHEEIAVRFFSDFFTHDIFVGQMRTRLGIAGMERTGPEEAAKALLQLIM
jgi:energy-coupling factor transporter ATP-binding protein EcfA2